MKEVEFVDALTEAEKAAAGVLNNLLTDAPTYRALNKGFADCNVFDIGHICTGEMTSFPAGTYHWRGQLSLFRRDRTELQKSIMRVLGLFPHTADYNSGRFDNTNIIVMRVAPETGSVSDVTVTTVETGKDMKSIPCYMATVAFDIVFVARFE